MRPTRCSSVRRFSTLRWQHEIRVAAVEFVAHDWMAQMRQMNTYLMLPAGEWQYA